MTQAQKLETLIAWATSHGGTLHSSLEYKINDTGFHATLREAVPAGVTLLHCPHALTLSQLNARNTDEFPARSPLFPDAFLESPSEDIGAFFLVQQRLLGGESFWYPYVAALPETFNTPAYFEEQDLPWITGPVLEASRERLQEWREAYVRCVSVLEANAWPTEQYTWDLYLWARTVFSSRSFVSKLLPVPQTRKFAVLLPLVDSLNHDPNFKLTWLNEDGVSLRLEQEVAQGVEICNNYGPKSNDECESLWEFLMTVLLGYGFCIRNNPWEQVGISFKPQFPPTKAKIRELQLAEEDLYYIRNPRTHPSQGYASYFPFFPPDLLNAMATYVANTSETEHLLDNPQYKSPRMLVAIACVLFTFAQEKLMRLHPLGEPANLKQHYAQIYREEQSIILSEASAALAEYVASKSLWTFERFLAMFRQEDPVRCDQLEQGLELIAGSVEELAENDMQDVAFWLLFAIRGVPERKHLSQYEDQLADLLAFTSAILDADPELVVFRDLNFLPALAFFDEESFPGLRGEILFIGE